MSLKLKASLVSLYEEKGIKTLKFESTLDELSGCLNEASLEPENLKEAEFNPNEIFLQGKLFDKKKPALPLSKRDPKKEERRQKVYKKGPLAKFYLLNQSTLDKDALVWYYKDGKQVVGPVSSYNMDKMVYLKSISGQTRIAFKGLEKFVRLDKIMKIVEENFKEEEESSQDET